MRVIAGQARRTALAAPKGQSTRPTADRIKESLFNIIASYVPDARFLDLFCGSGAIGIEALSRGASGAVFVDISQDAVGVTRANLARVRFEERALVLQMCAVEAISRLGREGRSFDVIFMDPPYGKGLLGPVFDVLEESPILAAGGIVVAEIAADEPLPVAESLGRYDERVYGSTRLVFFK